jgi:hypothetical protein
MNPKPLIDVGPIQAIALVAVLQGYLAYKATRLAGQYAWCTLTRREMPPVRSRYAMISRPLPPLPPLRLINGECAA